ncbi:MAG TPA: CARDB domain-containing protein, partial [Ruminiclostridium sp.]|nr:CARDB domain-containing protein [Ruminiclostridium sp.]
VKDNAGAEASKTVVMHISDNRPDLVVEDIKWNPSDPVETDNIQIEAVIGNIGKGPCKKGFLVGFYIDNQYIGYKRVESSELKTASKASVVFNWVSTPGIHVLKVTANDILDNINEIDRTNNSKTVALTTRQANFADLLVEEVVCSAEGIKLDSESPFAYRAKISNIGNAKAEKFFVSLYIDGVWSSKQLINILAAGQTQTLTFLTKAIKGKHEILVKADDINPSVVELDKENNCGKLLTPEFEVSCPHLALSEIKWLPADTLLTEGTALTFYTKIKNTSSINITHSFNVDFCVDGRIIRTLKLENLNAGEERELFVRWTAEPGRHTVNIAADKDNIVTKQSDKTTIEAAIPEIRIIYPDLNISDVQWSPLSMKYGQPVTFIARVSNQSVASVFKSFNVVLYVDGKAVAGKVIEGLRGHSTAIVDLTWTPEILGNNNVKIVVDDSKQLTMETPGIGVVRQWERKFDVEDSLIIEATPNEEEYNEDFLAKVYQSQDNFIPITAMVKKASNIKKLLGPESNISAFYTIRKVGSAEAAAKGSIGFVSSNRTFKSLIPISMLGTGNYQLTIEASDGIESCQSACNITIIQGINATVETDKKVYQFGEDVLITGVFNYRNGTPMANARIYIDMALKPALKTEIMGYDENGNQCIFSWHAQHTRILKTDSNGHFEYKFSPRYGEAGEWTVNVSGIDKLLGSAGKTSFNVLNMGASPSHISIGAAKNSKFSKLVSIKNVADEGMSLTGLNAVLEDIPKNSGVVVALDTSTLPSRLGPGETAGVIMNCSVTADAVDTLEYSIRFSSSEGAFAVSSIKLNLRPAVPYPVTDPKGIEVGVKPGESIIRTVKLTNKGMGSMTGISIETPQSIPWVTVRGIGKTALAPGESTKFDVVISPSDTTPLGRYQGCIKVTDGKFSTNITVAAEVSTANVGTVSFHIIDDTGKPVSDAEINLLGKTPYVQNKNGEQVTYYHHIYGRTNSEGTAVIEDQPVGDYTYTVQAKGHKKAIGEISIMPKADASLVEMTMETLPVQIEWTVKPTTIQDKYDITLEMNFGANIPTPKFAFDKPWISLPKQVNEPVIVEATVINTGLVAINDATASIIRENDKDTGISIAGGGYIGEIPAHGRAKIKLLIQPGYFELKYGCKNDSGLPYNCILLQGTFVSFDKDTGLPVNPTVQVEAAPLPLYNAGDKTAKLIVKSEDGEEKEEMLKLPDELQIDYFIDNPEGNIDTHSGDTANEIITMKLDQTATLERQAFNADLKITNGYKDYALQNLTATVVISDKEGNDVSTRSFIIPTTLNGIRSLDGSANLEAGDSMTAGWELIPGEGLGGTDKEGKIYLVKAIISYYVNGRYVETQTKQEEIRILPQPKIKLHYYVPHNITAGVPFRLGVTAENTGDGLARNLVIDSGKLNITTDQAGLLTEFEIIGTSFGGSNDGQFRLVLGDVSPHSQVTGYWLVKWKMYEDGTESKPYTGVFHDFKADLHHQDYKGIQLNPLVTGVTTEIIGQDNLYSDGKDTGTAMALIDIGDTGIPDYLINLKTGLKLPVYVPQKLKVLKQPTDEVRCLQFTADEPDTSPDIQDAPRYQVLMLKDPLLKSNIHSVTRQHCEADVKGMVLSRANFWKDYGNIYIIDEIPIIKGDANNTGRRYCTADYNVDFSIGAAVQSVECAQWSYIWDMNKKENVKKYVYYDIGHYPDEQEEIPVRACIINKGSEPESGKVEFFVQLEGKNEEVKIGEGEFKNVGSNYSAYVYSKWNPPAGGNHKLFARIVNSNSDKDKKQAAVRVNYRPYANAGPDFSCDVLMPAHFDGSRSYDRDGYIQSFVWEFGDGESGSGVCPVHTYKHSGSYKVKLTVTDDNNVETVSQMQITVCETRPDLRITEITSSSDTPKEGDEVTFTATIYNGGYKATDGAFLVGFYIDNQYQNFVKVTDKIDAGASRQVSFSWVNTPGNHMATIIANDIGHNIDEADFDNNQKSKAVDSGRSYFPNLKLSSLKWDAPETGVLDYNSVITLTAVIENNGTADAKNFNVAFFKNEKLLKTVPVAVLPYSLGSNSIEVSVKWNVTTGGAFDFSVMADGPLPHIVESDKTDNVKKFTSPQIKLLYPDIAIDEVTLNPDDGKLEIGQPVYIKAHVSNKGYSSTNGSVRITFYADGAFIGEKACEPINKQEEATVTFAWNKPQPGVKNIEAVADEFDQIVELSNDNNSKQYNLSNPLNVKLPDIIVEKVESTPSSGNAKYGDEITTTVYIKNQGQASTSKPFTTCIYVNGQLAGNFELINSLNPGSIEKGVIKWRAKYPSTDEDYRMTVFTDAYSSLYVADRGHLKFSTGYKVQGALKTEFSADKNVYTEKENIKLEAKVVSTDAPWRPLTPSENVSAELSLYNGQLDGEGKLTGSKVYSKQMDYDKLKGCFNLTLQPYAEDIRLTPGKYTACVTVHNDTDASDTVYKEIELTEDYLVTAAVSQQTYSVGKPIEISGKVTGKDGVTPVSGSEVTIIIVGEEEWKAGTTTDKKGCFSYSFTLPGGFGGAYSVRAEAKVNNVQKSSEAHVFYVEGPYISIQNKKDVTAGYSCEIEAVIVNAGSLPVNGLVVEKIMEDNSNEISAEFLSELPKSLNAGESKNIKLGIKASESAVPGIKKLQFKVKCSEGYTCAAETQVNVLAAKPQYGIDILSMNQSCSENKIITAVRPGESVTRNIGITNIGAAPIRDITVTPPERLPWVYISTSGTSLVESLNKGLSIRDANARAAVTVNISPNEYVQPGTYQDAIRIVSNAGTLEIPISINVSSANVGTAAFQLVNEENSPIKDGIVSLIGPMASNEGESVKSEIYKGKITEDGLLMFENIPAGTYTIRAEAAGYKTSAASFELPALINLIPKRIILEKLQVSFEWSIDSVMNAQKTSFEEGEYDSAVLESKLNMNNSEPQLISDYPGSEAYFRRSLNTIPFDSIYIKNPSVQGNVSAVQAEIISSDKSLPENSVTLQYGDISSTSVNLGDFGKQEVKRLKLFLDASKFCVNAKVTATEKPGEYIVSVPKEVTKEQFNYWLKSLMWRYYQGSKVESSEFDEKTGTYTIKVPISGDGTYKAPDEGIQKFYGAEHKFNLSVKLSGTRTNSMGIAEEYTKYIPVRLHFDPEDSYEKGAAEDDIQSIKIREAFSENGNLGVKSFSKNFLSDQKIDVPEEPEQVGETSASFGFSQNIGTSDEAFKARFTIYNSSVYQPIKDADFEIIITDTPLDVNGHLPSGGEIVNNRFAIECDTKDVSTVQPDSSLTLDYDIQYLLLSDELKQDIGFDDAKKDFYVYLSYKYNVGEDVQEGLTQPKKIQIEPPPKLYVSYRLNKYMGDIYDLEATVTNAG